MATHTRIKRRTSKRKFALVGSLINNLKVDFQPPRSRIGLQMRGQHCLRVVGYNAILEDNTRTHTFVLGQLHALMSMFPRDHSNQVRTAAVTAVTGQLQFSSLAGFLDTQKLAVCLLFDGT